MFGTTLILALREIRRHLLRSFLTVLGVVIGVAAVVTMVTLGTGATASVKDQISSLGANMLTIRPGQGFGRGGGGPPPPNFEMDDIEALKEQVAGVVAVSPLAQQSAQAVRNASNWSTTVTGTTGDYFVGQQWNATEGRLFSAEEEAAGKSVCLIGTTVRDKLFANDDPVGENIRLRDVSCAVIGVLASKGQGGFQDQNDVVAMPIKAVQRRLTGTRTLGAIQIAVDARYDPALVQASIVELLRERRNLAPGEENDFNIFDTREITEAITGTTRTMTAVMGTIAGVSLLVGGIGIMNIMLVSVTERTREIGIRLAIGAVGREVLMQFLVEAVVLSCLGGVTGLLLAFILTLAATAALDIPFIFDPQINLLAFAFSAAIGVIFGYFPARRAAALNPIEALRHE